MQCEGCRAQSKGFDLFDYCVLCSKNLCASCMRNNKCRDAANSDKPGNQGHEPSAEMHCAICDQLVDHCTCGEGAQGDP